MSPRREPSNPQEGCKVLVPMLRVETPVPNAFILHPSAFIPLPPPLKSQIINPPPPPLTERVYAIHLCMFAVSRILHGWKCAWSLSPPTAQSVGCATCNARRRQTPTGCRPHPSCAFVHIANRSTPTTAKPPFWKTCNMLTNSTGSTAQPGNWKNGSLLTNPIAPYVRLSSLTLPGLGWQQNWHSGVPLTNSAIATTTNHSRTRACLSAANRPDQH